MPSIRMSWQPLSEMAVRAARPVHAWSSASSSLAAGWPMYRDAVSEKAQDVVARGAGGLRRSHHARVFTSVRSAWAVWNDHRGGRYGPKRSDLPRVLLHRMGQIGLSTMTSDRTRP